jgi:hypothetical protein
MTTEESVNRLLALRRRLQNLGHASYYHRSIFVALHPLCKPDGHISPLKFRSIMDEHFESVGAVKAPDGTSLRLVNMGSLRDLDKHLAAVVGRNPRWWQDLCLGLRDIRLVGPREKIPQGAPKYAKKAHLSLISRLTDLSTDQRRDAFLAYIQKHNIPVEKVTFTSGLLSDDVTVEMAPLVQLARFNAVFNCTRWEVPLDKLGARVKPGQLHLDLLVSR